MRSRTKLMMCALFVTIISINNLFSQITVNELTTPDVEFCQTNTSSITLINSAPSSTTFDLSIVLDANSGNVSFDAVPNFYLNCSTTVGIINSIISSATNATLNITILPTESCVLSFNIQPNTQAISNVIFNLSNTYQVIGGGSVVSSIYHVNYPVYTIACGNPLSAPASFDGQVLSKTIKLINNGTLTMDKPINISDVRSGPTCVQLTEVSYWDGISTYIPLTGVTINHNINSDNFDLGVSDINLIATAQGLPGDVFCSTCVLDLQFTYEVTCCFTNDIFSDYHLSWSCNIGAAPIYSVSVPNSTQCGTTTNAPFSFASNFGVPVLNIAGANTNNNFCYGTNQSSTYNLSLTHHATSTGIAKDVKLDLSRLTSGSFTDIIEGSVVVNLNGVPQTISPIVFPLMSEYISCDMSTYHNSMLISLPDIPLGSNLTVSFNTRTCAPEATDCGLLAYKDSWKYKLTYKDECNNLHPIPQPTNYSSIPGISQSVLGKMAMDYDGVTDIDDNVVNTATFNLGTTSVWQPNTFNANRRLRVQVTLSNDLIFVPCSLPNPGNMSLFIPTLAGACSTLVPSNISLTCSLGSQSVLTAEFNIGPCFGNQLSNLHNAQLMFSYMGDCQNPNPAPSNVNTIGVKVFYVPDINCSPASELLVGCEEIFLNLHCPGCIRKGIHSLSYDIRRTSFGWQDCDNDSRWDPDASCSPKIIDQAYINGNPQMKTKRAMVGDVVEGTLHTLVINPAPPDQSYGPTNASLTFPYAYWKSIVTQGEKLELLGVKLTFTSNLLPTPLIINFPPSSVIAFNQTANDGVVEYQLDFSISQCAANFDPAFNPGYTSLPFTDFYDGLSIDLSHRFRVRENVGTGSYLDCYVNNTAYLGLTPDIGFNSLVDPDLIFPPGSTPTSYDFYCDNCPGDPSCPQSTATCSQFMWYCTHYGSKFTLVGYSLGFFYGNSYFNENCGAPGISRWMQFEVGPPGDINIGTHPFPFEFRNWVKPMQLSFTIPANYQLFSFGGFYENYNINGAYAIQAPSVLNISSTSSLTTATYNFANSNWGGDASFCSTSSTCSIPGNAKMKDDDFYEEVTCKLRPTCNAAETEYSTFTQQFDFSPSGLPVSSGGSMGLLADATFVTSLGSGLSGNIFTGTQLITLSYPYANRPNLSINAPPTYNGSHPTECLTFTVQNNSVSTAGNASSAWISFDAPSCITVSNIIVDGVSHSNPTVNNLLYFSGSFLTNSTRTVTICFNYNCATNCDLTLITGWDCGNISSTVSQFIAATGCTPESQIVTIIPQPAVLNAQLTTITNPITACSDVTYELNVTNTNYGYIEDFVVTVTLPCSSMAYVSGSSTFTYGTSYSGPIYEPVISGGGVNPIVLTWTINNLSSILYANGLPGILYLGTNPSNFKIRFDVNMGCNLCANDYALMTVNYSSNCSLNGVWSDNFNPLFDESNSPYNYLSVSLSATPYDPCTGSNITAALVNNNSNPISSNNHLSITVPSGSVATGFNIPPTSSAYPVYTWYLNSLNPITFNLSYNFANCGVSNLNAQINVIDVISCSNGTNCSINDVISTSDVNIIVTPPSSTFTLPTPNSCNGDIVSFSPDVICPGVIYEWNIDGAIYTGSNATHTFNTSGNFNVSLTASLGAGGCSSTSNNSITIDACGQPCDGTKFTTSINSCTVDFTAFPANNYANDCDAVMYAWNFNDGSPIPPYSLSNTVTHTFPASGTYTVCMAAICYDIDNGVWKQIEYCKYCEDVVVDCRKDTCKDVKFTSILTDCKIDLTAYAPGMAGCSSIEYEWNYGDGNSSGINTSNTISYTYGTTGIFNLCLTVYCLDEYGRVIATCRYCKEVKPECKNCGESKLIIRSDQCNASFEASVPGMSNCTSIDYVWYPGDGNVLPASTSNIFNYNYCSSGIYNVCFEANCYDSNSNLLYTCKVCKDVDIKCIEPFCIKVENPLAGSYTGVDIGRQIVSTPDGGYVIVGTVNSNSTTPANTNATNEGDTYFAKFDANNNIEFQLRLGDISGSYYNERGHSVLVRPDGYYVSGLTYKSYGVDHDIQIVKISINGVIEWGKRYGNNNNRKDDPAKLLDMSANGSGNILVVGSSNNSSTYNSPFDISLTNSDFIAFVIDPSGNQVGVLKKRYNYSSANTESEYARDAIKINIGNGDEYVIAGDYAPCTTTPGCTDRDAYIIKLDANLNVTASQKLSLPSRVETVSSVEFLNGQIIVGGSNQLTGSLEKAWLATLNATNLSVISSVEISNGLNSNSKILGMNKSADNKLLIAGRCTNNSNDDGLGIQLNLNGGYNIDWSVYSNYPSNRDYFSTITENYLVTGLRKEASPFVEEITISKLCAANGLNCCVENLTTAVSPITYSDNGQSYSSSLSLNTTSVLVDIPAYSFPVLCSDNTRLTISSQTMPDGNIVLYPNPNTGKFTIKSLNENLSILKIIIRDFSGREIYNVEATSDNIKSYVVDRDLNWNSGLYSVVIIDSDDQKHTYKISILK